MVGVEKMSVELASDSIQIPSRDDENNIHDQCDENNLKLSPLVADLITTGNWPRKVCQCDNMDRNFTIFMEENPRFYVCDFSGVLVVKCVLQPQLKHAVSDFNLKSKKTFIQS